MFLNNIHLKKNNIDLSNDTWVTAYMTWALLLLYHRTRIIPEYSCCIQNPYHADD